MAPSLTDLSPDLLTLICSHCSLGTSVNLARTCRTLSEHALKQVWHTLSSCSIIAYTLPRELWDLGDLADKIEEVGFVPGTLSFTRSLNCSDLARFRKYAPYVRAVSHRALQRAPFVLSAAAWHNLESILKLTSNCFPNLHTISKHDLAAPFVEPMYLFFSNSLRTFEYSYYFFHDWTGKNVSVPDPAARWTTALLATLPDYASNIRTFQTRLPRALSTRELLSNVVEAMSCLVSFNMPSNYCPPAALVHLSKVPTLHILNVFLRYDDYSDDAMPLHVQAFPSLQTVIIEADWTPTCVALLQQVRSPDMETLVLDVHAPMSVDDFHALATVLANCPSGRVLKCLTLRFGPRAIERVDPKPIPPDVFAILHGLHALREIRLERGCYAALDDDALVAALDAWPDIRVAELCSSATLSFGASDAPRVTLLGLAAITGRGLPIDAIQVPLVDINHSEVDELLTHRPPKLFEPVLDYVCEGLGLFRKSCSLKTLGVGSSSISEEDVAGVAAILSQWFPRLHRIQYLTHFSPWAWEDGLTSEGVPISPEVEEMYGRWNRVGQLVEAFALVREQEQMWPYVAGIDEALREWVIVEHSDALE
ncbi:hypothetical protein L226DRAFT_39429 [Lentinus tigrinus ALCF2SS1-7]|uniref:F-box domain-containing protein n=1 Tax=Lentinus tigrinus ALCF2SS1-6 TaxID=1328759 RepID=A0A5C2SLA8_9APHY|nr:hypothetical protein L227DRAFT_263259 [Lentinus tigrinus ALCF2SS1-6]RPD82861.1 hypothetical protein L226DRAFT_39429 [Lentinus tigrinus ALCF2SS1-7]